MNQITGRTTGKKAQHMQGFKVTLSKLSGVLSQEKPHKTVGTP